MAKIFTVNGNNDSDEYKRLGAFGELDDLDTETLLKLAKLSKNPKAVAYLDSPLVKAFI